jgi:tRNA-Thr(GGU) m(6)t(6)A37 methyltransferase TsaA
MLRSINKSASKHIIRGEDYMNLKPIGYVHSPYKERKDAPSQGRNRDDKFQIEILEEFKDGLKGIEKRSHLIVLYWLDKSKRDILQTTTPHDKNEVKGIFNTRSPARPNPIAFNIVDLDKVEGNILHVRGMDALDGSTVVDIKPYAKEIDCVE